MKNLDLSHEDAFELWKQNEDNDGWISKDPEEIVDDIEDYDERNATQEILYTVMYLYNIEFEDETQQRWRFVGDDQ